MNCCFKFNFHCHDKWHSSQFCFVNYHSFAHRLNSNGTATKQQETSFKKKLYDWKKNSWWLHISYDMWLATALKLCVYEYATAAAAFFAHAVDEWMSSEREAHF